MGLQRHNKKSRGDFSEASDSMLLLLAALSLSDCSQVFRATGIGKIEISGVTFQVCTAASFGGAIEIRRNVLDVTVVGCTFVYCYVTTTSLRVYIVAHDVLFFCCSVVDCRCAGYQRSGYVSGNSFFFSETITTRSVAVKEQNWAVTSSSTLKNQFPVFTSASRDAPWYGSGVHFSIARNLVFEFCEIRENTGQNCIYFGTITESSIRCLSLRSNSCQGA
jgi:hypothetical protein